MPLKKWVDAQIKLSTPQFDQEMADEDAEIDAADAAQDLPPTVFAPPVVKVQNQTAAHATDVPLTEPTATYVSPAAAAADAESDTVAKSIAK